MTWEDEREISWYLSMGQMSFERSTCGPMLDRADMFSVARYYRREQRPIYDSGGHVIGHATGVTARPTAELRSPSGYVVDDATLRRYAHVSAMLKRVERMSKQAASVLETFYGDLGEIWAANELYGRIGSLFHLTVKGAAMVRDSMKKSGHLNMTPAARIEVIVAVQIKQANTARAEALARCQCQAFELEHEARVVWGAVKHAAAEAA